MSAHALENHDTLDYIEITRLQRMYGDVCVRRAWDEMGLLCSPDATFVYDLGTGEPLELHGSKELCAFGAIAVGRFSFYQYIPLNTVVTVGDPIARGRLYVLEVGTDAASGGWQDFYGLYDDEYVLVDGRWFFAERRYRSLARRGPEPSA